MHVMCDVSGPDVDDCSKNGKKAAEAMSLSKEGKSVRYHLQDSEFCCLVHLKTRRHKLMDCTNKDTFILRLAPIKV